MNYGELGKLMIEKSLAKVLGYNKSKTSGVESLKLKFED